MAHFILKAVVGLIILSIIPGMFMFLPAWNPDELTSIAYPLFIITETATFPIALISCLFLLGCFAYLLKINKIDYLIKLTLLLAIATLSSQGIKSIIKNLTSEPRPYVIWLSDSKQEKIDHFYELSRDERQNLIQDELVGNNTIPNWLQDHWNKETGYSFPSGHTLFAALWGFLALFFFSFKKHPIFVSLLILWACLMELSRLQLGMHFYIDVFLSVCIAFILGLLFYYFGRKWQLTNE